MLFSFRDLVSISKEVGDGSRARISDAIYTIWDQCSNKNEIFYSSMIIHYCVYLALMILRNRGIGFGDKLICKSLLQSVPSSHRSACQQVFAYNPHFHSYIDFLYSITPETPIERIPTMYPLIEGQFLSCELCSPLSSFNGAKELIKNEPYIIENKYDGIRVECHRNGDDLFVFGRSGDV